MEFSVKRSFIQFYGGVIKLKYKLNYVSTAEKNKMNFYRFLILYFIDFLDFSKMESGKIKNFKKSSGISAIKNQDYSINFSDLKQKKKNGETGILDFKT